MPKKKKKTAPAPVPSTRGPLAPYLMRFSRFDWAALLLAGVIILVSLLAANHPYSLSQCDPYGFLLWFLLVLGHLPMEFAEFAAKLTGADARAIETFMENREALLLGACNLVLLGISWAVLRFWVLKRWGAEPLRIAAMFYHLFFFWGVIQLLCFFAVKNWSDGKVNPLHRNLKKPPVEEVRK